MEPTREDWLRVARFVEERRNALGAIPKGKVFRSANTYRSLQRGNPIEPKTRRYGEVQLLWETGAIDEILAGREPRVKPKPGVEPNRQSDEIEIASYIAETGKLIYGIAGNSPDEREQILRLLRAGAQRLRSRDDNI